MKEALKLSLALGAICLCAAAVVSFVNKQTADARHQSDVQKFQAGLQIVLPEFTNTPRKETVDVSLSDGGDVTFYRAKRDSKTIAVAGEAVSPKGYGGDVKALVGLKPDGTIRAVTVTAHEETPGLGTTVTDRAKNKNLWRMLGIMDEERAGQKRESSVPPNDYLDQYGTLHKQDIYYSASDAPFQVQKDGGNIDAVSGATISSRAVAEAVSKVCEAFTEKKERVIEAEL